MPKNEELYYAALKGDLEEVQRILDLGVDINLLSSLGETPLYAASMMGKLPVVKLLLERGAHINQPNFNGNIPLYGASYFNKIPTFEYLLEHGANVNQPNREGKTPLYAAATGGNKKLLTILLVNGAEINGRALPGYHDNDNVYNNMTEEDKKYIKEQERLNIEAAEKIMKRWPTTMWLTMLEELFVKHLVDAESVELFFQFYGPPKGCKRRKSIKKRRKTTKRRKSYRKKRC